jgi:hypothetical protein
VPPTSRGYIVGIAAALTFIPAFCVMQWFLDFPLAILGSACLGAAVLLLGRWPARVRETVDA